MKSNDMIIEKRIENMEKVCKKNINEKEYLDLIEVFSFYLSHTNRNYRYTETYLTDKFGEFYKFLDIFKKRHDFVEELYVYLKKNSVFNNIRITIEIIVDQVWTIEYDNSAWKKKYFSNGKISILKDKSIYFIIIVKNNSRCIDDYQNIKFDNLNEDNFKKIYHEILKKIYKFIELISEGGYNDEN